MGAAFARNETKQEREDVSTAYLVMFHPNNAEFLRRFITVDETRVDHFTAETK